LEAKFAETENLIDHLLRKDAQPVHSADGFALQFIERRLGAWLRVKRRRQKQKEQEETIGSHRLSEMRFSGRRA
jgi:hypothetical protein